MPPSIHGHVVDARGRPVPDARVAFGDGPVPLPDLALLTGADGGFHLEVPVPGRYAVRAVGDDGAAVATAVTWVRVPPGGPVVLVLEWSP
ncbi:MULTISPECIES: carboxypeptidase-like regulatory domain-containing protein [unclassified Serinicoccus]|uniref:carboxypeptidase-like regulatory domain-containing protein n=1 Tax=unclassified Serinicoccus TaxID=2643101 RepID=UPI003852C6BC